MQLSAKLPSDWLSLSPVSLQHVGSVIADRPLPCHWLTQRDAARNARGEKSALNVFYAMFLVYAYTSPDNVAVVRLNP